MTGEPGWDELEEARGSVSLVIGSFSHATKPGMGLLCRGMGTELGGDDQDSFVKQALPCLGYRLEVLLCHCPLTST